MNKCQALYAVLLCLLVVIVRMGTEINFQVKSRKLAETYRRRNKAAIAECEKKLEMLTTYLNSDESDNDIGTRAGLRVSISTYRRILAILEGKL